MLWAVLAKASPLLKSALLLFEIILKIVVDKQKQIDEDTLVIRIMRQFKTKNIGRDGLSARTANFNSHCCYHTPADVFYEVTK